MKKEMFEIRVINQMKWECVLLLLFLFAALVCQNYFLNYF